MPTTVRSADFIGTLGVNTHIDFAAYGYQNLSVAEASINYLGLKNLRDSPQSAGDVGPQGAWQQVANQTHAKFDAYIPEGSPADMQASLNLMPQLASQGILNYIEGGNEEDDPYAASLGNTLQFTADFQKNQVSPMGQKLGLPVINMSFGAGWTADNGWIGDYASVGNLSAYASFGNAHTYPVPGQAPDSTIQRINGLAQLADSADPIVTTEIGWDRNQGYTQQTVAKFVLDAAMDGIKDGDVKTYFYALFDDGAGKFGLMNQNGTPMPAGTAIHNLTTLLSDNGANASTFAAGALGYRLSHTTSNDNSLLFEKSDGAYWISLWNEVDRAHNVTVTLPNAATDIKTFDPLNGTSATQDLKGATSVTVRLTDHPLLVEVIPSNAAPPPPPPPPPSPPPAVQPNDLVVNVPASGDTVRTNTTSPLSGVSVSDPWAAQNPGLMALSLWDRSGAPLFVSGQQVTGTLHVTLNQLNADLAGLAYKAGASGSDIITVDVWNQAGVEGTASFGVTVAATSSSLVATGSVASNGVSIPGAQMAFIGSADHPAIISGKSEAVSARPGYNAVMTGTSDGRGGFGDLGAGIDTTSELKTIAHSGSASAFLVTEAGQGDVPGIHLLQSSKTLDHSYTVGRTAVDIHPGPLPSAMHLGMSSNDSGSLSGAGPLAHSIGEATSLR